MAVTPTSYSFLGQLPRLSQQQQTDRYASRSKLVLSAWDVANIPAEKLTFVPAAPSAGSAAPAAAPSVVGALTDVASALS